MPDTTIRLDKYTSPGAMVIAGQDRGRYVRDKEGLERLDKAVGVVTIIIPDSVMTIAPSFFLGMLSKSVEMLGEVAFREKYRLVGPDHESIMNEGIRRSLIWGSPFRTSAAHA